MQKLIDQFSQNSAAKWHMDHGRTR